MTREGTVFNFFAWDQFRNLLGGRHQPGGSFMPQYDYRCKKCKKEFSVFMAISEKDSRRVQCPKCKGKSVEQLIAPFMTKTSRKS